MWFVPDTEDEAESAFQIVVGAPFSWPVEVRVILLIGVFTLFLAPSAVFFGSLWIDDLQEYYNREPFDSVAWKSSQQFHNESRIRMVDNLLARHKLKGKSEEDIIALLGKPHETEHFSGWDMAYWLGPKRGFLPIDSEWLVLNFSNQAVSEFAIVTD